VTYSVDITLGAHSWSLVETEGEVTDGIRVLAGLQFGWTVPKNGLWPAQPDPMTASFAVNVPYFADIADVGEGDPVVIKVRADEEGDVIASFYGNVTNRRATPRPRRLGVTYSIVAADYTVQVSELPSTAGTDLGAGLFTDNVVPDISEGTFPFVHAVDLLDWVWVHHLPGGVDVTGLYTSDDVSMFVPVGSDIRPYIDNLLVQLVNGGSLTRMILAPYVDEDGNLAPAASGRYFTLDTLQAGTVVDFIGRPGTATDSLVFAASAIERNQLAWNAAKGVNPGRVQVTGFGNDSSSGTVQDTPYQAGTPGAGTVSIPSQLDDGADAIALAIFYANWLWSPWQIDDLTLLVTDADLAVPVGLFPDWALDEGDPGRASCYTQAVTLTGVQTSLTPDGTDTTTGVLMGAQCRITSGRLYIDLSLRTVPPLPPDATLRLGAIGEAPIGGLATT
jgi:hypothetical protein